MTAMRSVLLMAVLAVAAMLPAGAAAESPPPYDGAMSFRAIQGPEGPDEFSWEVTLYEEQELRQIDDRSAAVYYTNPEEHLAFGITAIAAHDAAGATVPTTLTVTSPNAITLTVHHRDGNPAADGAPFDYPVIPGEGWEGGFQPVRIPGPPDESELSAVQPPSELPPPTPTCVVPDLTGSTLRASRKMLNRSDCALGPIRGERGRGARVVRQYRSAGKSLPAGTEVGVKLLHP
jgi:hypothetical protein